ncbi:alpha/beta fold hydrolase [Mycoplasmopsis gallinarum]|uniref:alpha/beta fold hydrolase n=1 Tax=Mycoplasmopsis gallinarum TaxID=29557 RepID=UPI0006884F94|nr:alpha/beta hydrolase [Mycoplasmopsis gallinarum]
MQLNYLDVKNYHIPVYILDKKSDTTLLCLHGLNSSSDFIKPLIEFNNNFNIVALNFPGSKYFAQTKVDELTLEWWTEVAKEVLKRIKTKKIVLLAHSMAGGVAVEIGNDPRIEKIIMLATINPNMVNTSAYSVLEKIISPINTVNKILGKTISTISSKFKKTAPLLETFGNQSLWVNLLKSYVLNSEFMKELDDKYHQLSSKMIFIVGSKDNIIGTKEFIDYANNLNVNHLIIGTSHSPIKEQPELIMNFISHLYNGKKRLFWQKFFILKKHEEKRNINISENKTDIKFSYEERDIE